ncbi:MgtC/SapB family protein [Clostridium sp. CS001]|uniref:MgtC/SapB family protein n=1 Tax=Clostridium sp. CS001 TaxID=2880648 RepID=UPI001CF2D63A|nr:MgtC/SapB family protein [Clostridium sp. CS001]MCB2289367.1 MgtC/SapB family protein [Clostridium sp. CS001]
MELMYLNDFIKIMIACTLGGIIGHQRQQKGMSMGLRTHVVVCVSATLVQIISIDYNLLNNANIDVMRLGAQVISGIGFLGMASIIRHGRAVVGLTTAASVWFIACVGLAVGSNLYIPATMATVVIFLILRDVFNFDKRINSKRSLRSDYELELILKKDINNKSKVSEILSCISSLGADISNTNISVEDNDTMVLVAIISFSSKEEYKELINVLSENEFVKQIKIS